MRLRNRDPFEAGFNMARTRGWHKTIRRIPTRHGVLCTSLVLLLFLLQSCLIYYPDVPTRAIVATPDAIGLDYEPVKISTGDGLNLDGWYVPARDARGVLLFFHGNAGNISHRLESLEIFNRLRLSTLIFDYRGYGRSEGTPSEEGTYRDAAAAWRYLTEIRRVPRERIVLFGRSLGGAIAAHAASRHRPAALILESAFTSVPDVATHYFGMFPVRWLTRYRYDTGRALRTVSCPVLIIHSPDDEIIPFQHGRALFDIAPSEKRFLSIRGDHNTGFLMSGEHYVNGLDEFLAAVLGQ